VDRDAEGPLLRLHQAEIRPTRNQCELLPYLHKTVVLGIRPDAITLAADGNVPARVDVAEALGGETYIYADYMGDKITVKAPGNIQARSGDPVSLSFDPGRLHLFDKETKYAICH